MTVTCPPHSSKGTLRIAIRIKVAFKCLSSHLLDLHIRDHFQNMITKPCLAISCFFCATESILSDFDEVSGWVRSGLGHDIHRLHNILIMRMCAQNQQNYWPLLIDPDNQAPNLIKITHNTFSCKYGYSYYYWNHLKLKDKQIYKLCHPAWLISYSEEKGCSISLMNAE